MEGMQATDGSRYFVGTVRDVMKQAGGGDSLEDRLRQKQAGVRAARRQGIQKPAGNPFAPGRNSLDGKGTIPAASTGAQRKNLISTAPIPIDPVRKVPRENAQAGPSESRLDPRFIAGSRRKLNLNEPQESEVQWVTQGDPVSGTGRSMSPQKSEAGPSHWQRTPRNTRSTLQRTDNDQQRPPIHAHSGQRDRSAATNSRSASPTKKSLYRRRPSNAETPYEEEEQIEDPDASFLEDDIVFLEQFERPSNKATNTSRIFATAVAEGTRAGAARQKTGSASPTRATKGHVDTKGKSKAVALDIFAQPVAERNPRTTRQSIGSQSPEKPISLPGSSESNVKGKSPERGYIEIDEHRTSDEQEYGHRPLTAIPTRKGLVPTSGLAHDVLMCCSTQVVWCVDMKGEKRRIQVRQVELHADGIVLGNSKERRSALFISLSNVIETESCERSTCPFISLYVKTKLTETKLDSDRLKSLLLPGVTENSGRPPTQDEMSTLRFFLHLESGENSEDFIHTHRQLTGHLTHGKKFRLSRQACEAHRLVGPKPIRDEPEAPAGAKQTPALVTKNQAFGRTLNQDPALSRKRAMLTVELPSRNAAAKQSATSREKGKERESDPPKAKPSKIAKVVKTIFDMVPRQSKRLSGPKPNQGEAEDLCSEDELIPEPPKTTLAPPADRGKVLFPYPLTGRATLTITKGELWRVTSGEFLNDTLIEWGLQLLLSDLKGANSESDIHLFNSFFYTKISSKDRDKKLQPKTESSEARWPAYETIRKWTKSVDVFSKKFIIVPINEEFHWYLAVIHNPGLMLVQPPADTLPPPTGKIETSPGGDTPDANDENDVDAELGSAREESNPDAPNSIMAVPDSDEPMDVDETRDADDSIDPLDSITRTPEVTKMKEKMKDLAIGPGDAPRRRIIRPLPTGQEISNPTLEAFRSQHENHASSTRAEEPTSKAESLKPVPVKAERPPDHVILDSQKPWIITFDSLGSPHRAVGNNLAQWLQWEARDKKGGEYNHVQVEYTHAQVPLQANFSDCGLYLVHYARQLLTNPETILKFVERRLPRKDSDERKQFDADIDSIWGISRDHNLRDEWQAKINSLKEQYESQRVEKPTEDKPDPPKEDYKVAEGDSGEGFLEDVNLEHGGKTDLPATEDVAGQEADRMEGHGDLIPAQESTAVLIHSATADDQPPHPSVPNGATTVAEQSPQPLDSVHDDQTASETNSAMVEPTAAYHDELESDEDEQPTAPSEQSGPVANSHSPVVPHDEGRGGSPSCGEDEGDDDATSSVVTETSGSDDTGTSEHPGPPAGVDEYDAIDPALGGPEAEHSRPTTHLEDEGMDMEHEGRHPDPHVNTDAGARKPISSQASIESLRMIKNAGLLHPTNAEPSGKPISGKSAEEAIDVSTDDEDNDKPAPIPSHIHTGAEVDIPVSATPTTARSNNSLFTGFTPSSASSRKIALENRQPGTSPLTSLATSRDDADMIPPAFRSASSSIKRSAVNVPVPSSPLTPAGTDFGEVEQVPTPSRAEITSGKAKKAPPAAAASLAPWQADKAKNGSLVTPARTDPPVNSLQKFAHLNSDSSAENTPARPFTPVYSSMTSVEGSGDRQPMNQLGPMPVAMVRSNSGGLDTLHDPEPTSAKRYLSLDRKRGSRDLPPLSGMPGLGTELDRPSGHDNHALSDDPIHMKDISNSSEISPAKRPKTLDTRGPGRQTRNRPPDITATDQKIESRNEATSLPEYSSGRQLDSVSSNTAPPPDSRLEARSSASEFMLIEENGRPVIVDKPEEQYEAHPWAQNLLERAEDAGPSTSTTAPPFKRKTRKNQSTAMPLEEDFALVDKDGKPDNLDSRSDEDWAPKQVRRSSRHNTTSPQAPQGTHVAACTFSSDIEPIQNGLNDSGLRNRQSLGQPPFSKRYTKPVTYSNKGKKKQQDPQKPSSASHQSTLNFVSPAPSKDSEAGLSSTTRRVSANQKRQNDSPDSTTTSKKKKYDLGAPGHTPARPKRAVAAPRNSKHDPIDVSDSD